MADSLSAPDVVPVFPLPGTVFFPDTSLPLHVFEPRYRMMVRDAAGGDGLIAISLLSPGWEKQYQGNPPFHDTGTVGRITDLHRFPDGRFQLRLVALERVAFTPLPSGKPYQLARLERRPEARVEDGDHDTRIAKLDLLASHGSLLNEISDDGATSLILDDGMPFRAAVNTVCASLPVDASVRQSLLEQDDLRERHRLALRLTQRMLEMVLRLKADRPGGADVLEIN